MKIQVIGSGCPTCKKLHEVVIRVATELNLEKSVEYISGSEGITKILELGAMSSPLLVIDDRIVMTGYSGDMEKIKSLISSSAEKSEKDCCKGGKYCKDDASSTDSECGGDCTCNNKSPEAKTEGNACACGSDC